MPSKAKQPGQAEWRGMTALLRFFFQICQSYKSSCHSSRVSSTQERVPHLEMCICGRTGSSNIPCHGQRPELLRCTSCKLAISSTPPFCPDLPRSSFPPLLTHQGAPSLQNISWTPPCLCTWKTLMATYCTIPTNFHAFIPVPSISSNHSSV